MRWFTAAAGAQFFMAISLKQHFEETRASLVALYENSQVSSHGTVQGSLREGFVRSVLEGHVGGSVSWSTGQIVTTAPDNHLSGQLDLIAHRGDSPQVYIQDQFLRLIPSSAALAVVEVKSDLTTGDMAVNAKATSVLKQALDSLVKVRCTSANQAASATSLAGASPLPTFLVAYKTGITPKTVIKKTLEYLTNRSLPADEFWPTTMLFLKGPKAKPKGYAIVRDRWASLSTFGTKWTHATVSPPIDLYVFDGGEALAAAVCQVVQASGATTGLEGYVFS